MTSATIAVVLAVALTAGGCPAPRQRDKDQQTGMGPADRAMVRAFHDQRTEYD